MEVIIVSLLAGCILGASNLINESWIIYLDKIVMMTVFVILIAVGLQIGSNHELIANLVVLGWQAMVIAMLTIAGSVVVLWLVSAKFDLLSGKGKAKSL